MRKNDIVRRVLNKLENVKSILLTLYLPRYNSNEPYLSVKKLNSITGIPESTLKGVLKNLVKIGWIEKRSFSSSNEFSRTITDLLTKIEVKNSRRKEDVFWVPSKIADEFEKKLLKLKRTKIEKNILGITTINIKTYKDIINEMDPRKKSRVLKDHSLTFHGKTRLVNSLLEKWFDKKRINFYKILVFPYIIDDRVGGHTKLSTKEMLLSRWSDIPKRHEKFWREVAEELKQKRGEN